METYKYQLRRGGRKEVCPNCGQRRFVPYVLTEDNETIVNPEWGRCDRENSCGYWVKPNGNEVVTQPKPKNPETMMRMVARIEPTRGAKNSLKPYADWLVGGEKSNEASRRYHIATAYDGGCIFLQIDGDGIVRAGKIIRYKDGHRVKDGFPVRWLHKDKHYNGLFEGDALKQCFFGEHLLPERPDAPVAVVESEKTALLMSEIRPEYVWLATGGSCGLQNPEKTKVLEGRNVTLFPDNGMYLKWQQIAMPKGWAVNEECLPANEHLAPGYDILDLYEWSFTNGGCLIHNIGENTMKFTELSRLPKNGEPCGMVKAYYEHILQLGTLSTFLQGFDFESRAEIQTAVIDLHYTIYGDPFMSNKKKRDNDPMLAMLYIKAEKLLVNEGRLEKLAVTLSGDLWHKHFAPAIKERRFESMFSVKPDGDRFAEVSQRIMAVYGLDYTDIEKLRFFVEMVKARDNFPPSLRRMLYIWGKAKKTGKTTCAKMIVATLNGSDDWQNTDPDYTTTLANEMQIGGFKVPKIASCYCCMMDECFYADMGKTYHDFKRFLTSSGGSARLPYGQEFQWTGFPNYVATSNEPLRTFIKDWNDRRFLSVEFKTQPTEAMDFPAIHDLWRDFVLNSTPREMGWQEWSENIARYSDEEGERQTLSTEYAIEMRKPDFLNRLLNMVDGKSATSPDNQVTLKFFVDYFAGTEGYAVSGHRREIEQAVVDVFGERWNGYKYWRLDMLRQQASMLMQQVNDTTYRPLNENEVPY